MTLWYEYYLIKFQDKANRTVVFKGMNKLYFLSHLSIPFQLLLWRAFFIPKLFVICSLYCYYTVISFHRYDQKDFFFEIITINIKRTAVDSNVLQRKLDELLYWPTCSNIAQLSVRTHNKELKLVSTQQGGKEWDQI